MDIVSILLDLSGILTGKVRSRNQKDSIVSHAKRIAESKSLYSDTHLVLDRNYRNSLTTFKAWSVLFALNFVCPSTTNEDLEENLKREIWEEAYRNNLEGDWLAIAIFLEKKNQLLNQLVQSFLEVRSPSELFGPLVREVHRAARALELSEQELSVIEDHRPVHKAVWRRGYKDKGSLRPMHQRHRVLPEEGLNQFQLEEREILRFQQWTRGRPKPSCYYGRFR